MGFFMDTTDIFLNKLLSADKMYGNVSEMLGRESITDGDSLKDYLDSVSSPLNLRVFISNEETPDTPAEEALQIIRGCAESNDNIDAEFIVDEFLNLIDDNNRITSKSYPRSVVHRSGLLHPTVHIWFIRRRDMGVSVLPVSYTHLTLPTIYSV